MTTDPFSSPDQADPAAPADPSAGAGATLAPDAGGGDGVAIRTLVVGGMPLLVASVGDAGRGPALRAALEEGGVPPLASFIGAVLPRGATVGFMLAGSELRLVDERDDAMLRAPRAGLDAEWVEVAKRMRGTMTVVLRGSSPAPDLSAGALAAVIEERATVGDALGAIVGVAEERPSLPLMF